MGNCGEKSVLLEIQKETTSGMRFTGTIEAKADVKGRLFFPAPFRKILQENGEERLILKKDPSLPCLVLHPWSVWNSRMDELRERLNHWDSNHRRLLRHFVADAEELTLDKGGRILVPRRYLRAAAIEQEVVFLGMDDVIELWPRTEGAEAFSADETSGRELEELMKYGL